MLSYKAPKTRKISRHRGNAHNGALGGRIAPGLIVGWKDAQVAATDKVIVANGQQGTSRVEKLRVKDDLDTVRALVKELRTANVLEDQVRSVILHVVRNDRWKSVSLGRVDAPLQLNDIVRLDQVVWVGQSAPRLEGQKGYN